MCKKGRVIADPAFLFPFYLAKVLSVSDANHDIHHRNRDNHGPHNNHGIHRNTWDLHNNPIRHKIPEQGHRLQEVHNCNKQVDKRNK